jgi:hypothetical protein
MSTWAEDRRADRAAQAEQRRQDLALQYEQRRADRDADAQRKRDQADAATARRRAAVSAVGSWVRAHALDMLFVPVIVVPAVLAWTAMAAYGRDVFGGDVGLLLPLFSEAAMWAFAFAVPMAKRAGRPTGWLHTGVWVFAGIAAALNFVHGIGGEHGDPGRGVVMALVSVGGVIVHQLVTATPAKPRPTRVERDARRLERRASRRMLAVRLAAVRVAVADLAADGTATLVHRPGLVTLTRRPWRRARLAPVAVPGLPVPPLPEVDTTTESLADEISAYLAALPAGTSGTGAHRSGNAETAAQVDLAGLPVEIAEKVAGYVAKVRAAVDSGRLPAQPSQTAVRKFLRIRSEVAAVVHRVLTDTGPEGGATAVTA